MKHKPNTFDRKLGKRIKEIRQHNRRSQTWLGKKLKVSFQQIQKYENGMNRISVQNLVKIAYALHHPITDLIPS